MKAEGELSRHRRFANAAFARADYDYVFNRFKATGNGGFLGRRHKQRKICSRGSGNGGSSLKPVIGFAAVCDRYERIGKLLTKTLAVKRRLRPTTWFGTQKRPKRFALTGSRKSPLYAYASQTLVKGFRTRGRGQIDDREGLASGDKSCRL